MNNAIFVFISLFKYDYWYLFKDVSHQPFHTSYCLFYICVYVKINTKCATFNEEQRAHYRTKASCNRGHLSGCVGAVVPGSNLHQFLPAALCEVWFLRQRLCLQGRTKQPEENLLLLGTETLTACSRRHNEDMETWTKTEGVWRVSPGCARLIYMHLSTIFNY